MDERRFDTITKSLGAPGSRRVALRTAIGITVASALARLSVGRTTAKKKRRKHRKKWKKLQKNPYGCVNVGGACRGQDANCCSGICEGKKPKKGKQDTSRCVAHNELDCPAGADLCAGNAVACGTQKTACYQTTGQASFCAFTFTGICHACTKDVECEALQGPGAACVVCVDCSATGNTGCFAAGD
jgi:hypothetical protein